MRVYGQKRIRGGAGDVAGRGGLPDPGRQCPLSTLPAHYMA